MHYRLLNEPFPMAQGPPRSPGIHLTNITNDIYYTVLHGKDNRTDNQIWGEVGFIWEELLTMAFREKLANRPGEIMLEGVAMSPDGMDWENWVVHEYKVTWRSSAKLPVDDERWMMQAKGYCKGLGAKTVVMKILYLMGDYRENREPVYKVYEIVFSPQELEENWQMVMAHAKWRGWL